MEAREKYILDDLLGGNEKQFVIPVFQRNYVWGEKDCKQLFDDIMRLTNSDKSKHFIGAIVFKFTRFLGQQSVIQNIIIDGQQRLTTLTLLLKAFIDFLKEDMLTNGKLIEKISEIYLINKFAEDDNLKIKLKPNKLDGDNFISLMINDFKKIDRTSPIYLNYNYFLNRIRTMSVSPNEFYLALRRLQGVSVELKDDDNPQLIFESLNSTGIDLTDVDLIRNFLLMSAAAEKQDKFYMKYWLPMEECLGDNFINFIRDWLTLENGIVTPGSKHKVYNTFKEYYLLKMQNIEEFLTTMLEYSVIYSNLIKPNIENSKLNSKLNDYIRLDIQTTYPFVFGLLRSNLSQEQNRISDDELLKILHLLETYLIRRNICNLSGGGLSQHMAAMFNDLTNQYKNKFYTETFKIVSSFLTGLKTKAYFPLDDEFSREFINRDMYNSRNKKFILEKLENYKQQKEKIDFENLTVEHVMPRTNDDKWRTYLGIDEFDDKYDSYKNRIGNLTLTAYNSEMSNKPFDEKKEFIKNSKLHLNEYFKNVDEWKYKEIDARSKVLLDIALKIWKTPSNENIIINSNMQMFLLDDDDFDYTGSKPAGIRIRDYSIQENNWTTLLVSTLKYLNKLNPEMFSVVARLIDSGTDSKNIFSDSRNKLRSAEKIDENIYIEVNNNTEVKINILKNIFNSMKYECDEIIIYI